MTDDMDALRVSGGGTTGDMDALRVSGDSMTDDMDALRVSGGGVTGDMDALRRRLRGRKPGLLGATRAYAVLCPLLDGPGGPELLYEVRAAGIRQPGEVCFPGGRMEPGETPLECALRETEEELSIPRACVTPFGELDFLCNQRGFLLHPVAGYVSAEGLRQLKASPAEVSETFTVPVSYLRATPPERYAYDLIPRPPDDFPYEALGIPRDYPWARGRVEVPVWRWRGRVIWGMTARITAHLIGL